MSTEYNFPGFITRSNASHPWTLESFLSKENVVVSLRLQWKRIVIIEETKLLTASSTFCCCRFLEAENSGVLGRISHFCSKPWCTGFVILKRFNMILYIVMTPKIATLPKVYTSDERQDGSVTRWTFRSDKEWNQKRTKHTSTQDVVYTERRKQYNERLSEKMECWKIIPKQPLSEYRFVRE